MPRATRLAIASSTVAAALAVTALAACGSADPGLSSSGVAATSIVIQADGSELVVAVGGGTTLPLGRPASPSASATASADATALADATASADATAVGGAAAAVPGGTAPAGGDAAATTLPGPPAAADITQAPPTAAPTTVAATAATLAPTLPPTAPPPPTTPPPGTLNPAAAFVLSAVGIGPHAFGAPIQPVIDDLTARFGAPGVDASRTFSDPTGEWLSPEGEYLFIAPIGRELCWPNGLCVTFGGGSPEALTFAGWIYEGDELQSLSSAAGISIASSWARFPSAMIVEPGGCYSVGAGRTSDGIGLTLQGGDFSVVGDDGTVTPMLPLPEEVTVMSMHAGTRMEYLFGDC